MQQGGSKSWWCLSENKKIAGFCSVHSGMSLRSMQDMQSCAFSMQSLFQLRCRLGLLDPQIVASSSSQMSPKLSMLSSGLCLARAENFFAMFGLSPVHVQVISMDTCEHNDGTLRTSEFSLETKLRSCQPMMRASQHMIAQQLSHQMGRDSVPLDGVLNLTSRTPCPKRQRQHTRLERRDHGTHSVQLVLNRQ